MKFRRIFRYLKRDLSTEIRLKLKHNCNLIRKLSFEELECEYTPEKNAAHEQSLKKTDENP